MIAVSWWELTWRAELDSPSRYKVVEISPSFLRCGRGSVSTLVKSRAKVEVHWKAAYGVALSSSFVSFSMVFGA